MNEILLSGLLGLLLGALFFGGLWWTVRRGVRSSYPAFWFLGSWLIRTFAVLFGFYVASGGHLDRLLSCLAGFVIARLTSSRLSRSSTGAAAPRSPEVHHAP